MPTKVSVGLSKKAGLPNYGSLGASCHVELELDGRVLDVSPERFRQHVQRAYGACRKAVEEELARSVPSPAATLNAVNGNGQHTNGYAALERADLPYRNKRRTATPGQVRTIHGIAGRRRIDLSPLLDRLGVQNPDELSVIAASDLISELQSRSTADACEL
jgi:hypothetical protein